MNIKSKSVVIKNIVDHVKGDHISEFSAECSYYVILSFIPFIILLLTLVQYTNIEPQQLFYMISKILPTSMREIILGVIQEVYSKSIGTISISLIFTLFAADKGSFALMKGLRLVYDSDDNQSRSFLYLKFMSLLKTMGLIVLMVVGLVILVFGNTIISIIKRYFNLLDNYTILSKGITYIIIIVITFIVFLCIYKFLPGHKTTFKSQIRGAVFGSFALNIISFIFSKYLDIFKSFSTTYGSLTALMLVMMWTYACFYIIFLGAEINKLYCIGKTKNNRRNII
ncbi:MAG: YihY/virulence factor BrkB family protein [Clostridia bacterium]|nr:YihY/virulence factor BrkB family protein [Clostridia bacterium]